MYVDRLLEMGLAKEWGICGVGVLPADRKMADVMAAQDGLYTLLLENPDGSHDARVIGSIVDYRYAPDDPEAVIELLAAPSTRIISLTITEGGYNIDNLGGIAGSAGGRRRQRLRSGRRRIGATARPRCRVADDRVVRQHRGQRRRRAACVHDLRRTRTPGPGRVDERAHPLPQFDGGPHHPGHHARRHRRAARRIRCGGPVAGGGRAVHVMGARGRLLRRPATAGGGRRAAGRRRDALRVDEAAAAQRQPPEPVLFRVPGRLPVGARRGGRSAVRRIPARIHGFRGHADAQAGAGHRPARLQAHADRAVRQPRRARTPSCGCASARRTASRNGCCRSCGRTSPRVVRSGCRRPPLPAGRDTPRASTSRAKPIDVQDQLADTLVPLARSQHEHPTAFIENTEVFGDLASQPRFVEAYLWALDSLHRNGARATLETLLRKETT